MRGRLRGIRLAVPLLLSAAVVACTTTVPGEPVSQGRVISRDQPGGVDPKSVVENTDGGEIDRLAATVVADLRTYWGERFPETFGKEFTDLGGGYYSVDTADADAPEPPCTDSAVEVEGNAFYCPTADIIAWDRAALLPVLKDRFGEAAVMLVLAHEMGHAVQNRTGAGLSERRADPERFPTILIEAMADCYAGAFIRWVVDGNAEHLQFGHDQLDSALTAVVSFRDPIGTEATDRGAHGDAFDRVSAFLDGYESGVKLCSEMTVDNRTFTLSGFIDAGDAARGGNLEFGQIVESITLSLNTYFAEVAGSGWRQPQVRETEGQPACTPDRQGPVAFCPDGAAVELDVAEELPEIHDEIGDYATGTLITSRYALASLAAAGKPVAGPEAQRAAVCLTGAFTGSLFQREQQFLSPGDMDEAIQVLLHYDYVARDVDGASVETGFDRVTLFRKGFVSGARDC
ncbi:MULTISPECIES: neutral zinc metallopeptidase [Actinokineospora]|uniref:Aminopeptidase n=1 Tax=Actinokineospora fastidiosa TaxID=1816 RepID=A0A918LII3_9PSEU|nr:MULTISPECIES: neutral zinc metallopeptidase [Actinokineospora]UVS81302.1 putative metalloprotease [Actinokineospora sp. UTMC 2448]GGS52774.1 aminopeptidase [Actinokineospora fastidiosa]